MNLSEKAAYIRGLAEGLDLEADKKEVRVINELLALVGDMAGAIEDVELDVVDLFEAVSELDEDLANVEDEVYSDGCGCGCDDMFGEDIYELTCPNCGDIIRMDEELIINNDVVCPGCGEKIEIELDACDCGHDHKDE